ncbi:MAG TPA: lmo0937 family membrane protein [Candidatus Saccharimonadales bacterium]|nr:lmo0937 family membrane protein [Candidatus Saccharimonadales bacterium]
MIMTIVGILLILWLLGLFVHIGGGLIHILLVVALVAFIYNQLAGRKA